MGLTGGRDELDSEDEAHMSISDEGGDADDPAPQFRSRKSPNKRQRVQDSDDDEDSFGGTQSLGTGRLTDEARGRMLPFEYCLLLVEFRKEKS